MISNAEVQPQEENLVAIDPTIADSELAYEYHSAVCDSLGVSAMPVARFEEEWKARRQEAAAQTQQPAATNSAEKVSVSMQRSNGYMFVEIVSGGRDLSLRTENGTADELRAIAKEMREDAMVRLRRAALVLGGADELDRVAQAKKAA
ncbi:putative alpha/beta-hydrolase family hydrolase [Paraburkholderia sp. GAS448]|uniref:hypothetical protein n=1 Tax=Paraburkholderia sp. GAS448 TaxID=3035136 RepID=UPI003D250748